jgi:hypothetical protein
MYYTYSIQKRDYGIETSKNGLTYGNDGNVQLSHIPKFPSFYGKILRFNVLELESERINETPAIFAKQRVESNLRIFVSSNVVRIVLVNKYTILLVFNIKFLTYL